MKIDRSLIESISATSNEVIETARNVNELSHTRKQITSESLMLLNELMDKSVNVNTSFNMVDVNLKKSISSISENLDGLNLNVKHFRDIIANIDEIKDNLLDIASEVKNLINIVDLIKKDTDEINILATNATIVSGKYHEISSVFEVLSGKLNNMTEFINQNLEHIVNLVEPINQGIENMIKINSLVLIDIEKGHENFIQFAETLEKQKEELNEQVLRASTSGTKIGDQKKMLDEINTQVIQMDNDASQAIDGSGNVMKTGKSLKEAADFISSMIDNPEEEKTHSIEKIDFIQEQSVTIWKNAQNVNEKSKSQLEFSYSSLDFCKSIIEESKELEKTVDTFNKQSIENNKLTTKISSSIKDLLIQLNEIENRITDSNKTLKRFTSDYLKINDIMVILEKILKFMKIIGIYSKIEASRDPVEFEGFLTISKEIQKLQNHIKSTLPRIEQNIRNTKTSIDIVNDSYKNFSDVFFSIRESSNTISKNLEGISSISSDAEKISRGILDESLKLDNLLNDFNIYLVKLTEIVKKPIEGSAANIMRGKDMEDKSRQLKTMLGYESSPVDFSLSSESEKDLSAVSG